MTILRKLERGTCVITRSVSKSPEVVFQEKAGKVTDFQENPAHPLFPPLDEEDDDCVHPLVSEIWLQRAEQGKKVTAPRTFRGEELLSLNALFELYGGGDYELVAKHNGRVTARRRYTIPGIMKPMYDEGVNPQETKAPQKAQVINPMQAMMGSGGEQGFMGLIMMMMQGMMQQQAQAAQAQTQMFLAMMQGNQQQSAEEKANARAELQANIERERIASERTMTLMREMMQNRPAGGSGDEFSRGVEFYRSFANAQIEMARASAKESGEDGIESLLGTLMQAFQGYQAFKNAEGPAEAVAGVVNGVQ